MQAQREAHAQELMGILTSLWEAMGISEEHIDRHHYVTMMGSSSSMRLHTKSLEKVGHTHFTMKGLISGLVSYSCNQTMLYRDYLSRVWHFLSTAFGHLSALDDMFHVFTSKTAGGGTACRIAVPDRAANRRKSILGVL
jgi:hypothetical protein